MNPKRKLISLFYKFLRLGGESVCAGHAGRWRTVDICLLFAVKGGPLSMMTTFSLLFGGFILRRGAGRAGVVLVYFTVECLIFLFPHGRRL